MYWKISPLIGFPTNKEIIMKLGIIGAMEEEVESLLSAMTEKQ